MEDVPSMQRRGRRQCRRSAWIRGLGAAQVPCSPTVHYMFWRWQSEGIFPVVARRKLSELRLDNVSSICTSNEELWMGAHMSPKSDWGKRVPATWPSISSNAVLSAPSHSCPWCFTSGQML
jgi:hypothetical protein